VRQWVPESGSNCRKRAQRLFYKDWWYYSAAHWHLDTVVIFTALMCESLRASCFWDIPDAMYVTVP